MTSNTMVLAAHEAVSSFSMTPLKQILGAELSSLAPAWPQLCNHHCSGLSCNPQSPAAAARTVHALFCEAPHTAEFTSQTLLGCLPGASWFSTLNEPNCSALPMLHTNELHPALPICNSFHSTATAVPKCEHSSGSCHS
jgi:hypothetical protein